MSFYESIPLNWLYGVSFNLIGSVLINGGTNLIKLGHGNKSNKYAWYIGGFSFLTGSIINFVSFGFAPQSLLAALGSAQFVSNVFFGAVILGEKVTRRTILATVVILCGNGMIVYSFSHQDKNDGDDEIRYEDEIIGVETAIRLMQNFDATFNTFTLCLFSFAYFIRRKYKQLSDRVKSGESVYMSKFILPVSYAAYSAVFGAQSIFLAKCLSILMRARLQGYIEFGFFGRLLFVGWLMPTFFWLTQLNKALAMFDGLFIIPVMQVMWTFFSIISGGVFFKEFNEFDTRQFVEFGLGVLVIFCGVYLLCPHPRDSFESLSREIRKPSMLDLAVCGDEHIALQVTAPRLNERHLGIAELVSVRDRSNSASYAVNSV